MIDLLFSSCNLPQLAYAICNLCLNLICNCKITNKVFKSFVLILLEKNIVVSSRLSQVTSFIAIAQLNFIKESTSYIHNTVLGISNTTFT